MSVARWTAIALLSCLALAAAYLPPQATADRFASRHVEAGSRARLDLLNVAYQRTADLLAITRFRDSLGTAVRAHHGMDDLTVVIRRAMPAASQRALQAAVARVWRRAAPAPNAHLIVIVEPATRRSFQPEYVFPVALDGRTCAVKLMLDWNVTWLVHSPDDAVAHVGQLESWLTEALGPCLYYAAFGQPGPHIERWLEERYFKVANTADWDSTPPTIDVREEPQAYDMVIGDMTFDALGCLNGQLPRCREAVAHSPDQGLRFSGRLMGPIVTGVVRRAFWPRSFPIDDHYLSALVHDMGHERFARFWRSSAPLDSAFLGAFGQPLDVWTEHWARAFAPGLPPFTPAPRGRAVLFSILTLVVAVGTAAALVVRRQVS